MSTSQVLDELRSRILAGYPLLALETHEEERWENALADLALEMERGLVVWSATDGAQPPPSPDGHVCREPLEFLQAIDGYPPDHLFLLKDFHAALEAPHVVRKLRDLTAVLGERRQTLLCMSPVPVMPTELEKDLVRIGLPLPGLEDMRTRLVEVIDELGRGGQSLEVSGDDASRLSQAVIGLTLREAHKALTRALLGRDEIDDEVFRLLISEKKHLVHGSDLLEFIELDESVGDVGGLEGLKDWLERRREGFGAEAEELGLPTPRGVFLLGVQGCGKSLTARVTARILGFALVRLDMSRLLASDRGASERNLRDVLHVMESVAPAVLWLDELDKGFAGYAQESSQDATMARIVGAFLTWMEERQAPVFVVATANSIDALPPELLRRGRFDELFFIDLPNREEREEIFGVHLRRHGWKLDNFDLDELAVNSEGYSGAEIEQIVVSAMLEAHGHGRLLQQTDLTEAQQQTVPLSVTKEDAIFELREWARAHCRAATPDSRVAQMLDDEYREGSLYDDADDEDAGPEKWQQLAQAGQLPAAVVEYVRTRREVAFPEIIEAFADELPTEGELGLALRSDPQLVLWVGFSRELAELLVRLLSTQRLYVHLAGPRVAGDEPPAPGLPVSDGLPEERLNKPHWLPSCLRIGPPGEHSSRLARVARMKLGRK